MPSAAAHTRMIGALPKPRLPRARRAGTLVVRYGSGLALIAALLVVWQVVAVEAPKRWLPRFDDVASTYWAVLTGPALTEDVLPSLELAAAGLAIGIILGVLIGVPLGYFRRVEPWVRPLLEFGRALPVVTLLPIGLLILGPGSTMRISLIAFGCLFPVLWNAMDGARRIPDEYVQAAAVCGVRGAPLLLRVVLPATLPQIFAGIRVSLGIALIMMVISEMVAATHGLGALIFESQRMFDVEMTYAGVLVLGTVGALLNAIFLQVDKLVLRWHHGWRRSADG